MYGLKVNSLVDERCDPYKSTVAAARYLKDLYKIYNDWFLALAAYNAGPGRVNQAFRAAGETGSYWDVCPYLPIETQNYVPAFIGAAYAMIYAPEHNIMPLLPDADFHFQQDTIQIVNHRISLDEIAGNAGVDAQLIKELNPELIRGIVPFSQEPYVLRVPEKVVQMAHTMRDSLLKTKVIQPNLAATNNDTLENGMRVVKHQVKRGETLPLLAKKYNVATRSLVTWNRLWNYRVLPGQTIKIYYPIKTESANSTQVATVNNNKVSINTIQKGERYHIVQPGDTLWDIAKKYETTLSQIKQLNNLNEHSRLYIGMKLLVSK
jgi:membrane-bound lytic murein transglycosylase D